jgi:hypothetical protein
MWCRHASIYGVQLAGRDGRTGIVVSIDERYLDVIINPIRFAA